MPRSPFAGFSDFRGESLDGLMRLLNENADWLDEAVHEVDEAFGALQACGLLEDLSRWYAGSVRTAQAYFREAAAELRDIAADLPQKVEAQHIARLTRVAATMTDHARQVEKIWQEETHPPYRRPDHQRRQYERLFARYKEWEGPAAVVQQADIDLWDLNNIIGRLKDFEGRNSVRERPRPVTPWRFGLFYLLLMLVVIAALGALLGILTVLKLSGLAAVTAVIAIGVIAVVGVVIIGAFQAFSTGTLSQSNLLSLVKAGMETLKATLRPSLLSGKMDKDRSNDT